MSDRFSLPNNPTEPSTPKKSNSTTIIIVVVAVVLCCCCVVVVGGGYWLWSNGDSILEQLGIPVGFLAPLIL